MPLDPDLLHSFMPLRTRHELTRRDTILYALGIGVGIGDQASSATLRFVDETRLAAIPTMAAIMTYPGFWQRDPRFKLDWRRILHGEQSIRLHRSLPIEGILHGETVVDRIVDKGADKGALLYARREIVEEASGDHLATILQCSFLRGDGGFGGSPEGAPTPRTMPDRPPHHVVDLPTRPEQALLYRLSGDLNPLHIDPDVAAGAGFARPILQGRCTYGVAGRAILTALCDDDPARLRQLDARFTSPVYPGETIRTEIWRETEGTAVFRARALERDVLVLNNGFAEHG